MTVKINIEYLNNVLLLEDVPLNEQRKIRKLWDTLRDDYADWVAAVRLKDFGLGKSLVELLEWKGMSTWWLSPLVSKSVGINERWMNRLMILYLCQEDSNAIKIKTDDKILISAIKSNFENQNIEIMKSKVNGLGSYVKYRWGGLANLLRYIISILQCFERWLVLRGMAKKQTSQLSLLDHSIWFQTQYPANWIKTEKGVWQDRHLTDAPLEDTKHKKSSNYLVYLLLYGKDKGLGVFQLWKNVRSLEKNANRKVAFPEAHLQIREIIGVYLSTFVEWLKIRKWQRSSLFRDLFQLKGLDVSEILISEWKTGYWGLIQYCKLHGLATMRFMNVLSHQPTVVNYSEFYVETRTDYHLRSLTDYGALYYAVQHTQLSRNTGEAYNRQSEFSQNGSLNSIHYCPAPDYYLAHGEQYAKILSEFYPKKNISIIGSLKIKQHLDKIVDSNDENNFFLLKKLGVFNDKHTILIAASSEDTEDICRMLNKWYPKKSINIIFTSHPSSNLGDVKIMIKRYLAHLHVRFESTLSTLKVMTCVDLVISGFSNIVYESALYMIPSVRLVPLGSFYPREGDHRVPEFYDGESFNKWFNRYDWYTMGKHQKNELTQMAYEYYYHPDGKASERLWKILKNN